MLLSGVVGVVLIFLHEVHNLRVLLLDYLVSDSFGRLHLIVMNQCPHLLSLGEGGESLPAVHALLLVVSLLLARHFVTELQGASVGGGGVQSPQKLDRFLSLHWS